MKNQFNKLILMDKKSTSDNTGQDFNLKTEFIDYENLLNKLKKIKITIALLEKKVFS